MAISNVEPFSVVETKKKNRLQELTTESEVDEDRQCQLVNLSVRSIGLP